MNQNPSPPTANLTITEIDVHRLAPNPWNPNRMSPELMYKLRAYIDREGLVEPLVVRPQGDQYEILGGYHRWLIAKELGYQTVPCTVVNLEDRRAKILSINLNELKGQSLPQLLAQVIHDLELELSWEDLETQLPYSLAELKDLDQLLQIPDGLEALLDEEIAEDDKSRPIVLTFAVDDATAVEAAIARALASERTVASRGQALIAVCERYLRESSDNRNGTRT